MTARINVEKLRLDLAKIDGVTDKGGKRLADKVLQCCRQNQWDTPYDTIITPTHMPGVAVEVWSTEVCRDYFATGLAKAEPEADSDDDDFCVWKFPDSLPFQYASANLLKSKFVLCEKEAGVYQVYKIEDWENSIVSPVMGSDQDIRRYFGRAVCMDLAQDGVSTTSRRIGAMAQAYYAMAQVEPPPKLLGQPGELDWCLHRRVLVPDATMPYPHIQLFLDRLSDPEAFSAWWWGVASGENKGRQAVWLYDPSGQGGKSKIISTFAEAIFGQRIYTSFFPQGNDNQHLSAHYDGKKLVVIGDVKNSYILQTGSLKELTGDDKSLVNPKYQQPYSTRFECRVIILGNVPPFILRAKHSTSRILYITVDKLTVADDQIDVDYGEKCAAELPGWLAYAERAYRKLCKNHYAIAVNEKVQTATSLRIAEGETAFSTQLHEHFVLDPEGQITHRDFNRVCQDLRLNQHASNDFREWIKALHGLDQEVTGARKDGWLMNGIRVKTGEDHRDEPSDFDRYTGRDRSAWNQGNSRPWEGEHDPDHDQPEDGSW